MNDDLCFTTNGHTSEMGEERERGQQHAAFSDYLLTTCDYANMHWTRMSDSRKGQSGSCHQGDQAQIHSSSSWPHHQQIVFSVSDWLAELSVVMSNVTVLHCLIVPSALHPLSRPLFFSCQLAVYLSGSVQLKKENLQILQLLVAVVIRVGKSSLLAHFLTRRSFPAWH